MTGRKILRKTLKVLAWVAGSIIALVLLVLILIQIPAVQNFAKDKAVAYLENKIHTKVVIQRLAIDFPKQIVLEQVYFEDQQKDTLLSGGRIRVDIALLKLLSNKLQVDYLGLEDMYVNVKRLKPDYVFNYDYIAKAFASEDTDTTTSESSAMSFQLGQIELKNIRLRYRDDVTGNDGVFRLGKLETNIKTFDPDKAVYAIPKIEIADITSSLRQYKPLMQPEPEAVVEAESNEPIKINLQLNTIDLRRIKFDYQNDVSALKSNLDLGLLAVDVNAIDLSKLFIDLRKIELAGTTVGVVFGKSQQAVVVKEEVKKETKAQVNNPWKVQVADLLLDSNNLYFDDNNFKKVAKGIDYNHLGITGFTFSTKDLVLTPTEYKGNLQQLAFKEQSGLELTELHTVFFYNEKEAALKNLVLKTPNSAINTTINAAYPSIDSISKNIGLLFVDASIQNTAVAVKDVLLINPALQPQLKGNENAVIKVNGQAKGYVNNIAIPGFTLSGIGQTNVDVAGNIKGLPNADKAYYDIKLNRFNTTRKDILAFVPKNTLPESIALPDVIQTSGFFKGTMNDFNSRLNARTNKGNADIIANMAGKGKSYNVKANLNALDLGYILKQPDTVLGKISMTATAKGSGFDYKTMRADIEANVTSADVKGYTYKGLQIGANLNNGEAVVNSSMDDPNIRYKLEATANVKSTYPTNLTMLLQLDTLNLTGLNLTDSLFTLHTVVNADMASVNPDSLVGTLTLAKTSVVKGSEAFSTDSVKLVAERDAGIQSIALNSEVATLDWKGEFKLTETGDQVMQTIKRYYNLPYTTKDTTFSPQNWLMNILVNTSAPLVLKFMPELKGSDTLGARIAFNSEANDLDVKINGPHIQFGGQSIDNIAVSAETNDAQLDYSIKADRLGTPSVRLYKTSVDGKLANDELFTNILLKDKNDKDRYRISAKIDQPDSNAYRLSLNADSLLLNYDKWQVSNDNYIQYDSTGIIANNFALSHNEQSLSINSQTKTTTSPIDVVFKDFRIKTLTNFADQDSLLVDGLVNGTTVVRDVMTNPVFTSDIAINNLSYKKDTIGNITVKVDNETANAFNANVQVKGNGNDIVLAGKYFTGESRMDMKLDINNIDLATVKNFAAGQLKDASGKLKGNITIAGTTKQPDVNGSVHFENAVIAPTALGAPFKLTDEKIDITSKGVAFNNFTMVDSAGMKAVLNGNITTEDYSSFGFNLSFKADDFTAINSTQKDNPLFYGKLNMDADVKVTGTMDAPSVKAVLRANGNTNFTFVLPSSDPEVVSREGVVNFINRNGNTDSSALRSALDSALQNKQLAGSDFDVTFATDTAALFTLVVDERNGDALQVKGNAQLTGGIDQGGKLTMAGNYELSRGSYQVTLSLLKRKFEIQKGSVLTWKGDPTTADVDITAVYQLNTPTIDLIENQLAGKAAADVTRFKQKIPVQVLLKMSGELLKPQITFDVVLPTSISAQWREVDDKLAQLRLDESEMNKQVFSLLLLGRFTQEDPFESAGGSSNETMVRESVSRILTQQLNQLAGNLVKGVDLNFGLNSGEDYSTGTAQTRTDLTVGVSKSLLNDRLKVSVGSDFLVEGATASNESGSNIAGDVELDYQLTKDGRYRVRAYRVNKFEGVVEGQVVETGLTFAFTLDYDQFRELFNKSKKTKAKNKK